MDHNDDNFEEMKLDDNKNNDSSKSSDQVSYPKIDSEDVPSVSPLKIPETSMGPQPTSDPSKPKSASGTPKSVRWSAELTREGPSMPANSDATTRMPTESNRYVSAAAPASPPSSTSSTAKSKVDMAKAVLGRWGKKVGETAKKTENLAGNVWQHLKTGPSVADAAMGRIAHGTKVLAEGGYEKIFRQTFETVAEEQLQRSYACYLSTSAGPVMGTLYLSTEKLAFCSDNPLSYTAGEKTEWSYYKVVIPLHQLKSVNPSISKVNRSEKYIQVISVDDHEFWFMGFVNYENAVKFLQETL